MIEKTIRFIAVIDIGKTNAKVALVDLRSLTEIAIETTPNVALKDRPYSHFDEPALWHFIQTALKKLNAAQAIDVISITTHGACAALLDTNGDLAAPVLDYEHDGLEDLAADYDAVRPTFAETGSPRLPMGLNLGVQLHWLFATQAGLKERTKTILMWPQYWAYKLTGVMANEVTSLGCHTDLWNPHLGEFSSLPRTQGWLEMLPEPKPASAVLGPVSLDIAAAINLTKPVPVLTGIHDSNASLYPHLLAREAPFAVVSSGTWVVAMAIGGKAVTLDPARDTLINVNALRQSVPSARFMGGREFETTRKGIDPSFVQPSAADANFVLSTFIMLLPAVEPRSGPFQGRKASWTHKVKDLTDGQRVAALSFYLALMTATCLDIIGAQGPILAEGPFAKNRLYVAMLEAATGRPVIAENASQSGTSIGAALLAGGEVTKAAFPHRVQISASMDLYAALWRERVDQY
jgi:sugar (pentulose or hexulose) kinase